VECDTKVDGHESSVHKNIWYRTAANAQQKVYYADDDYVM